MSGDKIVVVRRRVPLSGVVLQCCVIRGDQNIPLGPSAYKIEDLRSLVTEMLAATFGEIINDVEAPNEAAS